MAGRGAVKVVVDLDRVDLALVDLVQVALDAADKAEVHLDAVDKAEGEVGLAVAVLPAVVRALAVVADKVHEVDELVLTFPW